MNPPSPFERFLLLVRLRITMSWRTATGKKAAFYLHLLLFFVMAIWSLTLGVQAYLVIMLRPERATELVHVTFLSVFLMQVALGVMSLASGQFFDPARVLHHPVGYREVFLSMGVGTLLAPMTLVFAAPGIASALAISTSPLTAFLRILVVLLLLLLSAAVALSINLGLLGLMSRRRLRDIASVFGVFLGCGIWIGIRSVSGSERSFERVLDDVPVGTLRWLPPGWIAEVFLASSPLWFLCVTALLTLGLFAATLVLGGRALKAAFLGEMPSPVAKEVKDARVRFRILPVDISEIGSLTRTLFWRHPHLKATYLRETLFLMMPILFLELAPGDAPVPILFFIPVMLAFSHAVFFQTLLGIDGQGLPLMLMSPKPRWRLLLARGLGVSTQFLVADSLLAVAIAHGLAWWKDVPPPTPSGLALLIVAVWVFDVVTLTSGTLLSVFLPYRLVYGGRRAVQGGQQSGCSSAIIRMLFTLPSLLLAGVLSALATLPLWSAVFPGSPAERLSFGVRCFGAALGIFGTLFVYCIAVFVAGRVLEQREEQILEVLTAEA